MIIVTYQIPHMKNQKSQQLPILLILSSCGIEVSFVMRDTLFKEKEQGRLHVNHSTEMGREKKGGTMNKRTILIGMLITFLLLWCVDSRAGVRLKIDDDSSLELGFRLQTQFLSSTNINADSSEEHGENFNLRRSRILMGGEVTKWVKFFIQAGNNIGPGTDNGTTEVQMIDALVNFHYYDLVQVIMGEHMAPAGREHLTSSAAMLAIDRPGITGYNLTWGLNGGAVFNTTAFEDGNLDLEGDVNIRDIGATLFGSTSLNEFVHAKYYIGAYNGIQFMNHNEDKERVTARVQVNLFEPEPGYYNLSTYLGKKRTVAIGASIDHQQRIAHDAVTNDNVNYIWYSFDAFADIPVGPGSATFEAGYCNLDLEDSTAIVDSASGPPKNGKETEGKGFYIQSGYYLENLNIQPWALFEIWDSDASDDVGSWSAWRVGVSYFVKGHNANIKAGFEQFRSSEHIGSISDDKNIESFLIGFYLSY
jgi:hypothetical protein